MNSVKLKTIGELTPLSFFIPSYQRRYRWTEKQVSELLNDICEFTPREQRGRTEKTWYCLQPVVVKPNGETSFEVIDGQQRLTTLYLILRYLNRDFVRERQERIFSISYETGAGATAFLEDPETENNDTVDAYFIHRAYKTIENWFAQKELLPLFDKNEFRSKVKFHTKVIWYETTEENPIAVFTRLNIGKINLTCAELVKAVFLNSSNFRPDDPDGMRLRQSEIAEEWDGIESALHDDGFWYFLSDGSRPDNRIGYIFDLMDDSSDPDEYSAFRYFYDRLSGRSEAELKAVWESVQGYYQTLSEWFKSRELYHKIGFLLTAKIADVKTLYKASCERKKSEFRAYVDGLIRDHYRGKNVHDFDYNDRETRNVLLLYNILTMLQNDRDASRFPFDEYKKGRWNIEHIASRKDASDVPAANRETWLKEVRPYVDPALDVVLADGSLLKGGDLIGEIDGLLGDFSAEDGKFVPLFEKITAHFNRFLDDKREVDEISNLALLDEKTNKGYKNAVFPVKRKYIIDRDTRGGFVPICTKNVFLKYFSDYPPKISFWTNEDREKYEEDLERVLGDYIEAAK